MGKDDDFIDDLVKHAYYYEAYRHFTKTGKRNTFHKKPSFTERMEARAKLSQNLSESEKLNGKMMLNAVMLFFSLLIFTTLALMMAYNVLANGMTLNDLSPVALYIILPFTASGYFLLRRLDIKKEISEYLLKKENDEKTDPES